MSDLKVSDHFYQSEVYHSDTAIRNKIDNFPTDPQVFVNARELAINILEPIRSKYGSFTPTSWYRGEELEKNICKKAFIDWCNNKNLNSKLKSSWDAYFAKKSHPRGQAADIILHNISNDELFNFIVKNLKFDQVIREYAVAGNPYSGWVHVSWAGVNNRNQIIHLG